MAEEAFHPLPALQGAGHHGHSMVALPRREQGSREETASRDFRQRRAMQMTPMALREWLDPVISCQTTRPPIPINSSGQGRGAMVSYRGSQQAEGKDESPTPVTAWTAGAPCSFGCLALRRCIRDKTTRSFCEGEKTNKFAGTIRPLIWSTSAGHS
ncbi:hypothetical protein CAUPRSCDRAFT_11226 [Caulochytrium protostelioides]|uniref:Uncharacterized protein n=1 Tax=Caulochytrium protostelioides TaxID=1555241 RepID=A0A4P9WWK5_9FUNG|nr:hypothetical protein CAUPRSCDRAFT_11226 [Caulochytrium protostelioides]